MKHKRFQIMRFVGDKTFHIVEVSPISGRMLTVLASKENRGGYAMQAVHQILDRANTASTRSEAEAYVRNACQALQLS